MNQHTNEPVKAQGKSSRPVLSEVDLRETLIQRLIDAKLANVGLTDNDAPILVNSGCIKG